MAGSRFGGPPSNIRNIGATEEQGLVFRDHLPSPHHATPTTKKMNEPSQETCRFFIDDSNLWIEAKKVAAVGKLKDTGSDPRLRVDLGQLVDAICKRRRLVDSYLFGSKPPPNDSVWNAARQRKFKVEVFDRSQNSVGSKEKEVDNAMATRMSAIANRLGVRAEMRVEGAQEELENTVFVVVTGDRDMKPPVEEVLRNKIQVELWAWESGLAKVFRQLTNKNGLLSVHHLDAFRDKITFTNFRSTRENIRADAARALVLGGFDMSDADSWDDLESSICQELITLRRLFMVRWWPNPTATESPTARVLIVEFPKAEAPEDFEGIIQDTRRQFDGRLTVVSAAQYFNQSRGSKLTEVTPITNVYGQWLNDKPEALSRRYGAPEANKNKQLTEFAANRSGSGGHNAQDRDVGADDNPNEWQEVRRDRGPQHHRILRHAQRCSRGIRCNKAGQCSFRHNEEERRLFQLYPNLDFRNWKTRQCQKRYQHSSQDCQYAHSSAEAWCSRCTVTGHFTRDCTIGY